MSVITRVGEGSGGEVEANVREKDIRENQGQGGKRDRDEVEKKGYYS